MARDYFIQTTSLVPPRGVSVEMTEIRPLRPNQAIILPGVAVLGHGLKFEVSKTNFFCSLGRALVSVGAIGAAAPTYCEETDFALIDFTKI